MKLLIKTKYHDYQVLIDSNLLSNISIYLNQFNKGQQFIFCYPSNLSEQATKAYNILKQDNYRIKRLKIGDGEFSKSIKNINFIINKLIDLECKRDTILLGFGGGSIGDTIGFVASIFMRGIRYINISTTLLSMVDASFGGKTGINYRGIKNIIGSFHHPQMVLIDPLILKTLDVMEIKSGLGEIIKYGFIGNPDILDILVENYNCIIQLKNINLITEIIFKCCLVKKEYIEQDEQDFSFRHNLNFGHTLGHIIESKYLTKGITHGEAILNGIFLAVKLSYIKGFLSNQDFDKIHNYFNQLDISYNYKLNKTDLEKINFDKKSSHNKVKFILLRGIGKPMICDNISKDDLLNII